MMDGIEKLKQDLIILEEMAAASEDYLNSDLLYWPLSSNEMPRMTLGAYLMRQHRLLALRGLLEADEQARLGHAIQQYNQVVADRIVRSEQRAQEELGVRLRQWEQAQRDMRLEGGSVRAYYATAAENRMMIQVLLNMLRTPPYRMEPHVMERAIVLDGSLRSRWRSGDFIWPEAWQAAYPAGEYWWLYGHPA
ncbi:MAG: hypothetical protein H6666_06985 [Ardenticatenaceae bacterium]|nr:hypothetical protein [Anaerolineales bacterium]MCB8917651.1 hypothetical protein [Ardenticatenaceae bacterium]